MINPDHARLKMVEEQLVPRGITDARVLEAMRKVPRHLLLEEALADRAYEDSALPIGEKQTISQPYIVAPLLGEQLREGGRRVTPVGARTVQRLELGVKQHGHLTLSDLGACVFVPFIGAFAWNADAC